MFAEEQWDDVTVNEKLMRLTCGNSDGLHIIVNLCLLACGPGREQKGKRAECKERGCL